MAKKANNNFACGMSHEDKVERAYKRAGAKVFRSPGSRGPSDMVAIFPNGKTHFLQVKGTCSATGKPKAVTGKPLAKLKEQAKANGGTPVVVQGTANGRLKYTYANVPGRKVRK